MLALASGLLPDLAAQFEIVELSPEVREARGRRDKGAMEPGGRSTESGQVAQVAQVSANIQFTSY